MSDNSHRPHYQSTDHANTHGQLKPGVERSSAEIDADFEALMRDGYVIIEGLLSQEKCEAIKAEGLALLKQTGRNEFEGLRTQRVYDLLSKTRLTDELATHPRILGLMDKFFMQSFLLSQSQIINIQSDEAPQALHFDDNWYRIPRPRDRHYRGGVWSGPSYP